MKQTIILTTRKFTPRKGIFELSCFLTERYGKKDKRQRQGRYRLRAVED